MEKRREDGEEGGWRGGGRVGRRRNWRMGRRRENGEEEGEDGEKEGGWRGGAEWGGARGRKGAREEEGKRLRVLEQGLSMLFLKAFRKSGFLLAEESLSYLHRKGRSCSMTQGARYNQNENIFRRQEVSPPACPCLHSGRSRLVSPPPPADGQAAAG